MASLVHDLTQRGLISPPSFLPSNIQYETIMGSMAYGVNKDDSDEDIYGFAIPPKGIIFPHLVGVIPGYDKQWERFDQYQQHHIKFSDKKEYDLTIFNIVKYFRLCADGTPNAIDSLFTSPNCVKSITHVGNMVRDERKIFLSKKLWHTYKGYGFSQLNKIRNKTNPSSEKRKADIAEHGIDLKFAYHVVRLINQVEQVLVEGDMDLLANREQLKSIRRGEWTIDEIEEYFREKEKYLEKLYAESAAVPNLIQEDKIKQLLLDCLEHHYGSLDKAITVEEKPIRALREIKRLAAEALKE